MWPSVLCTNSGGQLLQCRLLYLFHSIITCGRNYIDILDFSSVGTIVHGLRSDLNTLVFSPSCYCLLTHCSGLTTFKCFSYLCTAVICGIVINKLFTLNCRSKFHELIGKDANSGNHLPVGEPDLLPKEEVKV